MLQGIIFTCLICPPSRCGSFFESTAAVEGEYSRAVLGVDEAEKDWRLFDIWDRRFDKLPVISAKLSLRVMVLTWLKKPGASSISGIDASTNCP
ncbi:hypothetical protein ACFX2J_038800 [Malus domestica]